MRIRDIRGYFYENCSPVHIIGDHPLVALASPHPFPIEYKYIYSTLRKGYNPVTFNIISPTFIGRVRRTPLYFLVVLQLRHASKYIRDAWPFLLLGIISLGC